MDQCDVQDGDSVDTIMQLAKPASSDAFQQFLHLEAQCLCVAMLQRDSSSQ